MVTATDVATGLTGTLHVAAATCVVTYAGAAASSADVSCAAGAYTGVIGVVTAHAAFIVFDKITCSPRVGAHTRPRV